MLMVLVGIMVGQPMLLLVGGVAGASERLVESKLLERLGSDVASWRDGGDELLLECICVDCADLQMAVEDPSA